MAIQITGNTLSIDGEEFKKGDVTASKAFETKRKSDDGIPLKRLRAFNSASTFIDFNTERRGQQKGDAIDVFVRDTFEAFHIDPLRISLGAKSNLPLELTGSIKTKALGEQVPQTWLHKIKFKSGSNPQTYGLIMDGGIVTTGIITAENALSIQPGIGLIYGALGVLGGTGNLAETSQDIVVQPNTTTTINVSDENPSYTIAAGTDYTISAGADVTIINPNQTFTGGAIDDGIDSDGTGTFQGGVGNSSYITTNQTIPANTNTILYVTPYDDSITINSGVNFTISQNADLTIKLP